MSSVYRDTKEIEDTSSSDSLKEEAIKSSMGATSCSSVQHFKAFYLEMNRRSLPNEREREETFLLKAEDVGVCATASRHLV